MRISKLLLKTVGEGEVIPRGYGLAWIDYPMAEAVFLPIPLNVIVRLARVVYGSIIQGIFRSKYEKQLSAARREGWWDCQRHFDERCENCSYKRILGILGR